MPKKVQSVPLVVGSNPANRKYLSEVSDVTEAPSGADAGLALNRTEFIHVGGVVTAEDTVTFYIQVWYWMSSAEAWFKRERFAVMANEMNTIEVQGLPRVALQVDQIAGPGAEGATLDVWVEGVLVV